jgi:ribosomal protein S12 methylthiotransferase accessory factor
MASALWRALCHDSAPLVAATPAWRPVGAEQTWIKAAAVARGIGVTRLADVSGLDWLGLPVFQAVRPGSRNISVSLGKGHTPVLARVSALMEAIECHHAEQLEAPSVVESLGLMQRSLAYDVRLFERDARRRRGAAAARAARLSDSTCLDWVPATDLIDGRETHVPRALCELDFGASDELAFPIFAASSNGLASGNSVAEALVHGLCELIERDCLCEPRDWFCAEAALDLEASSWEPLRDVLDRIDRQGARVHVFDRCGPTGVPCYDAFLVDDDLGTFRGAGCHPDPHVAALRAVLESAQGRLAHIAGSRDDLERADYSVSRLGQRYPWPRGKRLLALGSPALRPSVSETACWLARAIHASTGARPLAVDLTRSAWNLPVVFSLAPGLRGPTVQQRSIGVPRAAPSVAASSSMLASTGASLHVVCFIGPTISAAEVQASLAGAPIALTLLPPAQQGDLYRLLHKPPDVVAIVDGEFRQVPALLHKEVLALLERGVRVLGAGSMGALRAAELYPFGMEGFGCVWDWYRQGLIEADDEVAVAHHGADGQYRPLSVALVNLRAQLAAALEQRIIDAPTAELVLEAARELHFSERTTAAVGAAAARRGAARSQLAALGSWTERRGGNQKKEDVLLMLDAVRRRSLDEEAWPPRVAAVPVATKYSQAQAEAYMGQVIHGYDVPDVFLLALDSLTRRDFVRFCRDVKFELIAAAARSARITQRASPDASESSATSPPSRRSILRELARRQGITERDVWCGLRWMPDMSWRPALIAEAKLRGRFRALLTDLGDLFEPAGLDASTSEATLGAGSEILLRFVARCWRVPRGALEPAAASRGFCRVEQVLPAAAALWRRGVGRARLSSFQMALRASDLDRANA